jgi:hypothetical protein
MRNVGRIAAALMALGLALGACDGDKKIETSRLEKSFSGSGPANKSAMDDLETALAGGDFAKAGAALKKLASNADLTAEQKKALEELAVQIKDTFVKNAKDTAKEVAKETEKAFEDVRKRLSN